MTEIRWLWWRLERYPSAAQIATSDRRVTLLGDVSGPDIGEYSVGQREAVMKKLSPTENSAVRP